MCTTDDAVKALCDRDPEILKIIEQSYGALLRRIAFNLGLNSADTEECVNDAYMQLWNTVPPVKPESIRAYVCMLMRRIVIDKIRYNSAGKRANSVYCEVTEELEACLDIENSVIDEMCIPQILNAFLEKQTPENREIFIRRYYEFENTKSISKDININANTVDKRLSRMRAELRKMLAEWGYII